MQAFPQLVCRRTKVSHRLLFSCQYNTVRSIWTARPSLQRTEIDVSRSIFRHIPSNFKVNNAHSCKGIALKKSQITKNILGRFKMARVLSTSQDRSTNIYTIPNGICMIRIFASPYIGYLVLEGRFEMGLCCFIIAGISDGD
jgi:hypothetical protein